MRFLSSLVAVIGLYLLAHVGVGRLGMRVTFGVVLPYLAIVLFIAGIVYRVVAWGRTPVPFAIATTCGQQRSLAWIKSNRLEAPHSKAGVIGRMLLEVLLFRSLWRETKTEVRDGDVLHTSTKWLWFASMAFHWSFLIVVLRHLRFFVDPVPAAISRLAYLDGFLQVGLPSLYASGVVLLVAVTFLFLRRLVLPQLRLISLPADYFPLLLILGIVVTGLELRCHVRIDVVGAKQLMMGLLTFRPVAVEGLHWFFYVHLLYVVVLLAYFPYSKLVHMGGVFLSPTRNMRANSREVRHVNPWNHPVPVHSYGEYEDEYREKMVKAGIPVEKEKVEVEED